MKEKLSLFYWNEKLAKIISKITTGGLATIIHFMTVSFIMGFISKGLMKVIGLIFDSILMDKNIMDKMKQSKNIKDIMQFKEAKLYVIIVISVSIITFLISIILTVRAKRVYRESKQNKFTTFGKARFSYIDEIKNAGLLKGTGVVFGKKDGKLISKAEDVEGHMLLCGPPGTGKTAAIAIPTLFKWLGAALVIDIKGEIAEKTKSSRIGEVFIFNPEDDYAACYDPIKLCNTVDGAQELARTLIPSPKSGEVFFAQAAQGIFSAFLYEGSLRGYTITDIAERICITPVQELIDHCRNHNSREVRLLCSVAYDTHEKTMSSIMAELKNNLLTIATDENIRRATRKSDFTPETLEKGATIYLQVSEHLLEQYKPLWTVIISQFLRYLSRREEKKQPAILLMLDEMPRLGKIEKLTDALATLRSRNVHILQIIQSMAQLDEIYGVNQRKIIADNSPFKLVLGAGDPETQKYFSDLAGQRTAMSKGVTVGAGIMPNVSRSETGIPLIRPEEWAKLEKPILFIPRLYPVQIELTFWFKDKFFK